LAEGGDAPYNVSRRGRSLMFMMDNPGKALKKFNKSRISITIQGGSYEEVVSSIMFTRFNCLDPDFLPSFERR
jgi:site-specific DNA-adenine methylase